MIRKLIAGVVGLGVLVTAYAFYNWYRAQDVALTRRPPQEIVTVEIPQETSQIGLRATVDYPTLAGLLNDLTSEPFRDAGADKFFCQTWLKTKGVPSCKVYDIYKITCEDTWIKTKGPNVTIGYRWDVTVQRHGPIQVSGQNGQLKLVLPIKFNGNAGLRGDGAKYVALNKKNFDGALTATVLAKIDLDKNWCPVISLSVSHSWDSKARIEIFNGVNISVSGSVDKMVSGAQADLQRTLSDLFTCDDMKKLVSPYWASYTYPIQKVEGLNAHVNAIPQSIALSGIRAGDQGVGIALKLDTQVSLDPHAIIPEVLPLPALQRAEWHQGAIKISLPISASMTDLQSLAAREIAGKTYEVETPAGSVELTVNRIEIYQSSARIAIGLDFVADIPGEIFSTSGEIFLLASPVIDQETEEVYLTDVAFSRTLDNDLWETLSAVFHDRIATEITKNLRYDFTEDLAKIRQAAVEKLNEPDLLPGLTLNAREPTITLAGPYISDGNLTVLIKTQTAVDGQIQRTILMARP